MTRKEEPAGWGLSSEQYDEDKVLEVDSRSVDQDELRKRAKHPHATWSDDEPEQGRPEQEQDEQDRRG